MQENQKETSYSDGDVITEFDRYLFAEGTHYEIYKKMGAHLMTQTECPERILQYGRLMRTE